MSDNQEEIPPGFTKLTIKAEEMDYLMRRWELSDHGQLFNWAVKMLHDLTKLDEGGWITKFVKAEIDIENGRAVLNPEYRDVIFYMAYLAPRKEGFMRLPTPKEMDEKLKIQ